MPSALGGALKLGKLAAEAKAGTTGVKSIGDINKLIAAEQRLAKSAAKFVGEKDGERLLTMLSSADPKKQARNYEAINAFARHADEGDDILKGMDPDQIAALVHNIDDPKFIEEMALLKKAKPQEFELSLQKIREACAHTTFRLWDLMIPSAHAALCDVGTIQREIEKLAMYGRGTSPQMRTMIAQGYKVKSNISVPRLEQEGYVGFDLLQAPAGTKGAPLKTKIIAYDGSGKAHVMDLLPGEIPNPSTAGRNALNGSNYEAERRVIGAIQKKPNSVSEANWEAIRRNRRGRLQETAREQAEDLGRANLLHPTSGSGISKGSIKIKYQDGTEATYNYAKPKNSHTTHETFWSESIAGKPGQAKEPKWLEVDSVTFQSEKAGAKTQTIVKDVEKELPEGLRRNDYTRSRDGAQKPSINASDAPMAPPGSSWKAVNWRESSFVPGQKYKVRIEVKNEKGVSEFKEVVGTFDRYLNNYAGDPAFRLQGEKYIEIKTIKEVLY